MKHVKKKYLILISVCLSIVLAGCKTQKYTVYFDAIDATFMEKDTGNEKSNFDQTHIPTYEGYIFNGWYLDPDYLEKYVPKKHQEDGMILYAKWTEDPKLLDMFLKAYDYHLQATQMEVIATGTIDAGITTQKLYGIKQRIGETYYQYTATSGMAKSFNQFYGTKERIEYEYGTPNSKLEPSEIEGQKQLTFSEIKESFGVLPNELNYILTKDTVQSIRSYQKKDKEHSFKVILDNEAATVNYKKNIQRTNTYKSEPAVFSLIELSVVIDENGYFKSIHYQEIFEVKVKVVLWISQTIQATIEETFNYQNVSINPKV